MSLTCDVTVCAIWKFKMATSGGQSLHWNPMGNNISIFFLRTAEQNLTKLGRDVFYELLHKSCYFGADSWKKHGRHVTLNILIRWFSRNFFSWTADGIELKSGIYVPMNVFNICSYCLRHLKIQNGRQRRSKFALKPFGKQHVHLLENSWTEFNQTWQRCFLWGPKNLSWFVLTRPTCYHYSTLDNL